jgi:glutamyl-tRNA synthetase
MNTRFAPSPTGNLHIGGARTALFNYLLARKEKGRFLLRIEDTDATRSTEESTQSILKAMEWLGLSWDGEPVYQRARADLHRQKVEWLVNKGRAYWCHCSPEETEKARKKAFAEGNKPRYNGMCREKCLGPAPGAVVRFKGPPSGQVGWTDLIKGPISFDTSELDDLVILRGDGLPTYNLAVVVDDIDMGVTEVLRGDDHVNNTPRQILIYQALEAKTPNFGHLPMIMGPDKKPLSKRHGAASVMDFKQLGYLPEALVNYLARLGWSSGDREIFSLMEMEELFSLKNVGKSAAMFNQGKLDWLCAHYIKSSRPEDIAELLKPFLEMRNLKIPSQETLVKIVGTLLERSRNLADMAERAEFFLLDVPIFDTKATHKVMNQQSRAILDRWKNILKNPIASKDDFDNCLTQLAMCMEVKPIDVAQPLRLALTGSLASPGLFDVISILDTETILKRISALRHLQS